MAGECVSGVVTVGSSGSAPGSLAKAASRCSCAWNATRMRRCMRKSAGAWRRTPTFECHGENAAPDRVCREQRQR